MSLRQIETDHTQRELSPHGTVELPLQINHDRLYSFFERYVRCHWHEDLEISIVVRGAIRYQLRDRHITLQEGQGILINTRVPHAFSPLSREEPELLTTVFHPSLLYGAPSDAIYKNYLYPYLHAVNLPATELSEQEILLIRTLDHTVAAGGFGFEFRVKELLYAFFHSHLSRYQQQLRTTASVPAASFSRMQPLLDCIHAKYKEPLQLSELAKAASLSKESCCRLFKKMTGKTIFQYLEDYRVSQGILLLQTSDLTITEISYLIGFSNPSRFSAAFSSRMNTTPHQYRRQLSSGV